MAVWNVCTMLQYRALSSFCRTSALFQKSEDKLSAIVLKLKKPKKPATSFIKFMTNNQAELLKKYPGVPYIEITKIASKMWSELPEKEKSSYNLKYSMEMQEYKMLMENYLKEVEGFKNKNLLSAINKFNEEEKKLMGKPNRPLNSLLLFRAALKKSAPDVPLTMSTVMKKWKACDDYERKKFEEEFTKASEKYRKELLEWEKQMYKKGYTKLVRTSVLAKLKKGSDAVEAE